MIIKVFFVFISLFFSTALLAQESFKKNDIYLEGGGNGFWGSVNYGRQLTKRPGVGFRLGAGIYTEYDIFITYPVGVDYLIPIKSKSSFINFGLGITWAKQVGSYSDGSNGDFKTFLPSIGYRKHFNNNMMWRFSLSPSFYIHPKGERPAGNETGIVPWAGFSLGKRF